MAFIIEGTGQRTAESWDGEPENAALLHIEFSTSQPNTPPTASGIGDHIVYEDAADTLITLTGFFDDAEDGPAGLAYSVFANDNPSVVGTSISGNILTLSYAPNASGEANITIRVTDTGLLTVDDTFTVTVVEENDPPTADAGVDQNVDENTLVNLSGSGTDVDGTIEVYAWIQIAGTPVTLSDPIAQSPFFTAPEVGPGGETLTFSLNVTDNGGAGSPSDTVDINVADVPEPNDPPTADAGVDQNLDENTLVNLSGSGTDSDGTVDFYSWTQTAGTAVTLSDDTAQSPTFTSPEVGPGGETLTFSLVVTDDDGDDSPADTVDINVSDVPAPVEEIHVGDLDVSKTGKNNWHARVVITVHDEGDSTVSNISVSGDWSGDSSGSSNCVTDEFGQCEVSQSTRGEIQTFTVTGLTGSNHEYDDTANHDSDGDSDGTVITIYKDGMVPGINVAPQFTSDPIDGQSVTDGQQYSGSIADDAVDSNGDILTFSKLSGPAWLVVSSDGSLSGTAAGTLLPENQEFSVQVSDPFGLSDTATLQIQITEPLPQEDIHIGLMDGTSAPGKGPRWTATISITVHDSSHAPLSGITVSGSWSGDANGSGSCVTDGSGICSVEKTIKGGSSATFTVNDLTGTNVNYVPGDNDVSDQFSVPRP
jgi:hypothetical protein